MNSLATSELKLAKFQGLTFNELLKLTKHKTTTKQNKTKTKEKNKTLVSLLGAEHKYTASTQLQAPFLATPHAVHSKFRDCCTKKRRQELTQIHTAHE